MKNRKQMFEAISAEATAWRRELHENPQTMYEEEFASAFIAKKLTEWGIPHETGIAGTGVVGTIEGRRNASGRAVAFRADIDALDITEASGQAWASKTPGKMHACGHDGHTATLLALAWYLNETRNFDGLVRLVFQPAEEAGTGALRMLEEGLLERFPFDEIYGYHNFPGVPRGTFAICPGPMLAAVDEFAIQLKGKGGHAAMPHQTQDMVPAAAHLVLALQTLVSRETDPLKAAVVTVANIRGGTGAFNVIGETVTMGGTVRTFDTGVQDHIEERMRAMAAGIAAAFGGTCEVMYKRILGPTINDAESTEYCEDAGRAVGTVVRLPPIMGGEDFGAFLKVRPGAFMGVGQTEAEDAASPHNSGLHTPQYDFNDRIIPLAAEYFAELAERRLPVD